MTSPTRVFLLPDRLSAKADPVLIDADEAHFGAIRESLAASVAELTDRLDELRQAPGGAGQAALDRDLEIHRTTARLRTLRRFGVDVCLGRLVTTDGEVTYIGRLGLTDDAGRRLLVDWRSPAAEPFFGATHADPMGLTSRRRYRWTLGRVTYYWDEVFSADAIEGRAALDDQSAFIASLGASRSAHMRDVLGTIQVDQDTIIRAGSRGALVVDGGPGTGKTVVALHRTAYLLYSDPRLGHRQGGVLFVGPSRGYVSYVSDVLPSLGEEGVQIATLRDLVAEGAGAPAEADPEVARLKASARLVTAVESAVRVYETPPTQNLTVSTPWADVRLGRDDWAEAFDAREPGVPHNEARDAVWEALVTIVLDRIGAADDDGGDGHSDMDAGYGSEESSVSPAALRRWLAHDEEVAAAFAAAWPVLDPAGVVADLWAVPTFLARCAPWLSPEEVELLRRDEPRAWTVSDLPLLDAARQRIGDPAAVGRARRREAERQMERERRADIIDELIAADDSALRLMAILREADAQNSLDDESVAVPLDLDLLAGPFAHIVVDEAQELTDAEWQMLLLRCPSRSFTIVGDRAQARAGFAESWEQRLERVGFTPDRVRLATLHINYRTPEEVMAEAEPVIRAVLPDANVPESVRRSGVPVRYGSTAQLDDVLEGWLADHHEGTACVISADGEPTTAAARSPRIRRLTPVLSKGLEFDLVVLVDPDSFGGGVAGAVDRYVAMTRATQQLVIVTEPFAQSRSSS